MKSKFIQPLIVVPKFLTKAECTTIIKLGNSKPAKLDKFGAEEGRYSHSVELTPCMYDKNFYLQRLHKRVHALNKEHYNYVLNKTKWEHGNFLRYDEDNFTNWHYDGYFGKEYSERKLTAVILLNEGYTKSSKNSDYTGGIFELPFYMQNALTEKQKSHMRKPGTLLLFPSTVWHRVTPVNIGTRYSLGYFFTGPLFK